MSDTRQLLINTMKTLLWQRGYDATSPNQVLDVSGVGKGSMYHHFKSKKELAIAAMDDRADELIKEANQIFAGSQFWLKKFEAYLFIPRDGMVGCRLGRIISDPSVVEDPDLQRPIKRYFQHMHQLMEATLSSAQDEGHLVSTVPAQQLAYMVISAVQGGFVVSRGCNDGSLLQESIEGVYGMLKALVVE